MQRAIEEVNKQGRVGSKCVRLVLEQEARRQSRKPALPLRIKRDDLLQITLPPIDMRTYDKLTENDDDEEDT